MTNNRKVTRKNQIAEWKLQGRGFSDGPMSHLMSHLFARSFVLLLVLSSAIPAFAEKTYRFRKLPAATLRGLAAVPAPPPLARENRHERRDRTRPEQQSALRTDAVSTPLLVTTPTIAPPPVATGFDSDTSKSLSPADSSGAVSKAYVISASNAGIVVHTRSGARVTQLTLSQFWRNSNTVAEFYDPRLTYDAAADRWITVAIRNERALMLAVSKSGDPAGAWHRYEVPIDQVDFTRLALTRDTLLVFTTVAPDVYSQHVGVLFSFDKAVLYTGSENLTVRQYSNLSSDACPVDAPDSAVEYLADVSNSALYFKRLDQFSQPFQTVQAGFTWAYADYYTEPGEQAGTTNILELDWGDVQAAVYRDGWLYAVHRISTNPKTNDDNALLWWRIDPNGVRQGTIGLIDSPAGVNYAFPSLAVSRNGGMLVSYCVLSKTTYPSAAYIYRDPTGRISTPGVIRNGNSPILSTNRWGDYTTVVTDPANDRDFWVAQIYASSNDWQSWWAQVTPAGRGRVVRK